jgi:hypothetical protein
MAPAKGRKLKVFQAPFGFYESVIAAPSQAAALRAWNSHQNLFAEGLAKVATDEAAIEAALAHPETPLLRAVGSNEPFELEPRSLPKLPHAPKRAKAANKGKIAHEREPELPPDRSKLNAAADALQKIEQDWTAEEERFRRRRKALEQDEADARGTYLAARKAAKATLKKEREAYRKAGGRS